MKIICYFLCVFLLLWFNTAYAKKCQSEYDKFSRIQLQQKQAHSAQKSIKLHQKEQSAWKRWQDCKKGKKAKKKSKKKKNKQRNTHNTTQSMKLVLQPSGSAFATRKAVVIKGKYRGEKQQAWLQYYKMPKACKKPATTQKFAACLENKEQQQKNNLLNREGCTKY